MRPSAILAGVALATAIAASALPAAATETAGPLELFQSICLKHQGDMASAEADATARGLELVVDNRGKTLEDHEMEMVFHANDGPYILLIGPLPDRLFTVPGADLTFCGVLGDDDGELLAAGLALPGKLGLPAPTEGDDTYATIFYREGSGGRVGLPNKSAPIAAAIRDSEFRSYDVRRRNGQTMISLSTGLKGKAK